MSDNQKHEILDLINQVEDKLSTLFHYIEEDETITYDSFRNAEKYIDSLYTSLNNLRELVAFS